MWLHGFLSPRTWIIEKRNAYKFSPRKCLLSLFSLFEQQQYLLWFILGNKRTSYVSLSQYFLDYYSRFSAVVNQQRWLKWVLRRNRKIKRNFLTERLIISCCRHSTRCDAILLLIPNCFFFNARTNFIVFSVRNYQWE